MNENWFYLDGQERKGPFDIGALRQLLKVGVINPDSWVAKEGDAEWKPAKKLLEADDTITPPAPSFNELEQGKTGQPPQAHPISTANAPAMPHELENPEPVAKAAPPAAISETGPVPKLVSEPEHPGRKGIILVFGLLAVLAIIIVNQSKTSVSTLVASPSPSTPSNAQALIAPEPATHPTTRRTVEWVTRAIDFWHCKYPGVLAQHWQKFERGDFNPGAPSPPPDLPRTDVIGDLNSNLDLLLEDFFPGDLQCRGIVQDEWNRNLRVLLDGDGDGKLLLNGITHDARAIVWSMGADGIDNQGGGDDVVALLIPICLQDETKGCTLLACQGMQNSQIDR